MNEAHGIALNLIRAYKDRADKASASVTAGVTGLFRWDGQYYAINDGSGPNVTEVDVGDLGEPKRYQGKA